MLKTEIITFNVKNRGRKHRGSDRNFDTAALANLINSGAVQERVKNGDLHGYYGHWPREKFGMQPPEGAVVDGRQVEIIPALVTTLLQADPDGTIRHQAKFLDTPAGQLAARLYKSKTGGFSSAINSRRVGGMSVPTGFFGFDYVLEPNFTGNRGYEITLDSAGQPEVSEFDAVEEYNQSIIATNALFDSIQSQFDAVSSLNEQLLATNQRLVEENEALVSMLARAKPVEANLDAVQPYYYGGGENRLDSAESAFLSVGKLPAVVPAEEDKKPEYGGEAKGFLRRALGF